VKAHLAKHYRQFDMTPPWEEKKSGEPVTTKTSPAERGQKEADMDEKEKAALELKVATHEKTISTLNADLTITKEKATALEGQCARLVIERDAEKSAKEKAEGEVVELEINALIGKKIAPAEKDVFVRLRKTDRSLFDAMISQRSEMPHLKSVLTPENPSPAPVQAGAAADADWAELQKQAQS